MAWVTAVAQAEQAMVGTLNWYITVEMAKELLGILAKSLEILQSVTKALGKPVSHANFWDKFCLINLSS